MFDRPERVLVMMDGDLASIVAAANAKEAVMSGTTGGPGPALWPAYDPRDESRRSACQRLASSLGLSLLERRSRSVSTEDLAWAGSSRLLLDACTDAAASGRSEVIWPVQFEKVDLDAITRAIDRALLVTRLLALDAELNASPSLHVEAPMVDLTDAQVADLAVDLAAPLSCCWWWGGGSGSPERTAAAERWLPALRSAGFSIEDVVR
jgi:hypothetical protein